MIFGFDAEGNSLNFEISTLKLKEIYASVQVDNVASNRILVKCGMNRIHEYEENQELLVEYRINSDDWMINSSHTEFHKD